MATLSFGPRDRFEDVVELDAAFFTEPPPMKKQDNFVAVKPKKKYDVFDYVPPEDRPPYISSGPAPCGGIHFRSITDENRPLLEHFCELALGNYNAENKGAKFRFVRLSHFRRGICNGYTYYITFEAKDANAYSKSAFATCTFQTKIWQKFQPKRENEVILCRMKPSETLQDSHPEDH